MKKLIATFSVICFLTVASQAGWVHTAGYACNPETSEPGTCFWIDDPHYRGINSNDSDSILNSVIEFISEFNPLDF